MKKLHYILLLCLVFFTSQAQILDPVKWTSKIEKTSDKEYILTFNGSIEDEWHVYSQFTNEGGALPLEVILHNNKGKYEAAGKAEESKTETAFNDIFGVDETFFSKTAELKQKVKVTGQQVGILQVELYYQVCKEVCIQQNKYFEFGTKNSSYQRT
jgi:thiol:disulfide interchange protein DsbD